MAKDSEAERQSVAEITSLLLQARKQRIQGNTLTKQNENHIRRIISHVLLWKHSEADGDKYNGCRYWSVGAIESFNRHGKAITSINAVGGDALRHEHLFPRKHLIDKLLLVEEPTVPIVKEFLDKLNIAVIVTVNEDKLLGNDPGDESDPWSRYNQAGIKVEARC